MRFLLIIICSVLTLSAYSDEGRIHLKKKDWEEQIKELDYSEEVEPIEKEEDKETGPIQLPDMAWVQYGGYVVIAIVVLVFLILIILKFKPVKTINPTKKIVAETIEEAEDNLPSVVLDKIYQEAIDKADFRAALRIKFLMVLQKMIDAKMIRWKKRKTNEQYLTEISDINISGPFSVIVTIFDDVWYGETKLNATQFEEITNNVELLTSKIHSGEGQ